MVMFRMLGVTFYAGHDRPVTSTGPLTFLEGAARSRGSGCVTAPYLDCAAIKLSDMKKKPNFRNFMS